MKKLICLFLVLTLNFQVYAADFVATKPDTSLEYKNDDMQRYETFLSLMEEDFSNAYTNRQLFLEYFPEHANSSTEYIMENYRDIFYLPDYYVIDEALLEGFANYTEDFTKLYDEPINNEPIFDDVLPSPPEVLPDTPEIYVESPAPTPFVSLQLSDDSTGIFHDEILDILSIFLDIFVPN